MNLEELRTVQNKERQTDSLQHLRDSFYADVGEYVRERKAERERAAEAAENPFSAPEVGRMTDEIETAESVVEAVWERRMGKLVKRASLAAAGMPADDEGLTDEERELFAAIVDEIEDNRRRVLDVLAGDASAPTGSGTVDDAAPADPSADATADATGEPAADPADDVGAAGESAADETAAEREAGPDGSDGDRARDGGEGATDGGAAADRTTVRITRDVGEIFCVDEREYHLSAEDVVTLPAENAEPLVERDAAEPLE